MKIVSAAGAIENGEVEPDTVIGVSDELQICDQRFTEHDYHGNVGWPVSTILAQSSNIGTIKLADLIGKDELYRYMKDFGFGENDRGGLPERAVRHRPGAGRTGTARHGDRSRSARASR